MVQRLVSLLAENVEKLRDMRAHPETVEDVRHGHGYNDVVLAFFSNAGSLRRYGIEADENVRTELEDPRNIAAVLECIRCAGSFLEFTDLCDGLPANSALEPSVVAWETLEEHDRIFKVICVLGCIPGDHHVDLQVIREQFCERDEFLRAHKSMFGEAVLAGVLHQLGGFKPEHLDYQEEWWFFEL